MMSWEDIFAEYWQLRQYILSVRAAITKAKRMPEEKVGNGLDLWGKMEFVREVRKE